MARLCLYKKYNAVPEYYNDVETGYDKESACLSRRYENEYTYMYTSYTFSASAGYTYTGEANAAGSKALWYLPLTYDGYISDGGDAGSYTAYSHADPDPTRLGACISKSGHSISTKYPVYYMWAYPALRQCSMRYIAGTYIADLIAEDGTYPDDGKHTDGYYYVKQGVYSGAYVKVGGVWRPGEVYVKVNGVWIESNLYAKIDGVWKY